jgi:hypothetical protein
MPRRTARVFQAAGGAVAIVLALAACGSPAPVFPSANPVASDAASIPSPTPSPAATPQPTPAVQRSCAVYGADPRPPRCLAAIAAATAVLPAGQVVRLAEYHDGGYCPANGRCALITKGSGYVVFFGDRDVWATVVQTDGKLFATFIGPFPPG